jgi:hypothetical protein
MRRHRRTQHAQRGAAIPNGNELASVNHVVVLMLDAPVGSLLA